MKLFHWLKSLTRRGRRSRLGPMARQQRMQSVWRRLGITSANVSPAIEALEDRSLLSFTATLSTNAVTFNGDATGDTLTFDVDVSGNLRHNQVGGGFNSNIDLDTTTGGDQPRLASTVTSLTVNAEGGADTITLDAALTGLTGDVTINGGTGDDTVNLNADITFASNKNLNVDLQNDDMTMPGTDVINVGTGANLILSGSGAATLTASKNIALASGSSVVTVDGNLEVKANQQVSMPTTGNFVGVNVNNGLIQATGTGTLTVQGKGGNDGSGSQYGVLVQAGGDIIGGMSALLSVLGIGGASNGNGNSGLFVTGAGSTIGSGGSNVSVSGTGGGATTSASNFGIRVAGGGQITAGSSGTVSVVGVGGSSTGMSNHGVSISDSNSKITSSGNHVSVTGTEGGGTSTLAIDLASSGEITTATSGGNVTLIGNSMAIATTATISTQAAGSVTLRQRSNTVAINLGSATDPGGGPLSLTDDELDRVTAGTVQIGDSNSGTITVSAAITHPNSLSLTTGAGITVNQAITMAVDKNLTATSTSTSAGISLATTDSDIVTTGTGTVSLTATREISLASGSSVTTVNGGITLSANATGTAVGNFAGLSAAGATIQTTGTGNISLVGQGGGMTWQPETTAA